MHPKICLHKALFALLQGEIIGLGVADSLLSAETSGLYSHASGQEVSIFKQFERPSFQFRVYVSHYLEPFVQKYSIDRPWKKFTDRPL